MIEAPFKTKSPQAAEQGVDAMLCNAQQKMHRSYLEYEKHVRKSPGTSILAAMAAGYCLHRLPVRAILAAQARMLIVLAPPALLLFGAAKVCQLMRRQETANIV